MGSGDTTVHVDECPFCEAALDPSDSGHSLNAHLRTSPECRRRGREIIERRIEKRAMMRGWR